MAIKIGIVSQKGGVGKSTLARAIAVKYASKKLKVKIADMDLIHRSCILWNVERTKNEELPQLEVQTYRSPYNAIKHEANFDVLIFDGNSQSISQAKEIAAICDLLVLPTGVSKDDLNPQIQLAKDLLADGIKREKINFSISQIGDSELQLQKVIKRLKSTKFGYLGYLEVMSSISQALDMGLAPQEVHYTSVTKIIDKLLLNIIRKVKRIKEKGQK